MWTIVERDKKNRYAIWRDEHGRYGIGGMYDGVPIEPMLAAFTTRAQARRHAECLVRWRVPGERE